MDLNILRDIFIYFELDNLGHIQRVNDKFSAFSELSTEEVLNQDFDLLVQGGISRSELNNLWKTLEMGLVWEGDLNFNYQSRELGWLHLRLIPEMDAKGNLLQVTALCTDISSRKKKILAYEEEKEHLLSTSQLAAIGEMSANIAQEVANPLMIIQAYSRRLIEESAFQDWEAQAVVKIHDASIRINKIIRGLKKVTRSADPSESRVVDIKETVNELLPMVRENLKLNEIDFEVRLPNSSAHVLFNDVQLGQVILNLINNARDVLQDCQDRRIILNIFNQDGKSYFQVRDSGPGVPPKIRNKIFNSFFTTKPVGEGTGLGLALCKEFIERKGGEIYVYDVDGMNCFEFHLPLVIHDTYQQAS